MYLSEFIVPEREHFVEHVRYIPRPPLVVRGALNPWELERTREIWMAEEAAWKEIQQEQVSYRAARQQAESALIQFNRAVGQLEELTGKKTGMGAGDIASFVAGSSGNPYILAALGVKMLVEMVLGSSKKKKINAKVKELERLQALITQAVARMETISQAVLRLARIGEAYRSMQTTRQTVIAQQSEQAYSARQRTERERGKALAALNQIVAQRFPMRKDAFDAL